MKIQPIIPQIQQENQNKKDSINNKNSQNVKFTGAFDAFTLGLRFLETNQAWGVNAVDLGSMVIPRTTIDFVNRGPAAGMETGRREASGTINHSLVGVYGTVAGFILAASLNHKYGIKAHKIFVDDETLEILGKAWDKQVKANNSFPVKDYLNDVFGNAKTRIDEDWIGIPKDKIDNLVEKFSGELYSKNAPTTISKDLKSYAQSVITHATGSETNFKLAEKQHPVTLSNMLDSIYNVSRTFVNEKVGNEFKLSKDINANKFINALKNMNLHRSMLGLGIAAAIGMSIQPLNIYLTKKKTGSDGFVGVEGRQKDNSAGFWVMKALASAAFGGGILASIGLKNGIGDLLKKIQFKGLIPTLDQFKYIYGVTIKSRFMAARDKDE